VGIPTAVVGLLQGDLTRATLASGAFGANIGRSLIGGFIAGLFGLILQGTIIYGAVGDLNGRPVSVTDSLRVGLRAFLPLLGLGILLGLAIGLGLILLIVPGVLLALAWCVAVPAYVVERPGIIASIQRSAELTRGSRLMIFVLFIVYLVASIVIGIVFGAAGGILSFASGGAFSLVSRVVIQPVIAVAQAMVGATGAAVLYVDLRRVRDGVGPEGLSAIFD
jgi:hypothetical protein